MTRIGLLNCTRQLWPLQLKLLAIQNDGREEDKSGSTKEDVMSAGMNESGKKTGRGW